MNEAIKRHNLRDRDIVIGRNPAWINGAQSVYPFTVILAWDNWSHNPLIKEYPQETFESAVVTAQSFSESYHINYRIEQGL